MPMYWIKVMFERSGEVYWYTGQTDNQGATFSARRKDAIAVNRYDVGKAMGHILGQREVYHSELVLA